MSSVRFEEARVKEKNKKKTCFLGYSWQELFTRNLYYYQLDVFEIEETRVSYTLLFRIRDAFRTLYTKNKTYIHCYTFSDIGMGQVETLDKLI